MINRRILGLIARHQTGAICATLVDFLVMIAWVEVLRGSPVSGAGVGAGAGALTAFLLGRRWIFRATSRSVGGQALRYALVAASSLGWNSLGQALMLKYTPLPYVVTRAMVAIVVGIGWNFQLQRRFVFNGGRHDPALPADSAGRDRSRPL